MFKRLLVILCLLAGFTELTPAFWQRATQRGRQAAGRTSNILRTGLENRAGQVPRARTFPQARQPYTNTHPAQAATHATAASAAMHAQNREEFRARQHQLTTGPNGALVLNLADLNATDDQDEENADDYEATSHTEANEEDWENESELRPLRSQNQPVALENEEGLAALLTNPATSSHIVNRFQRTAQNAEATVQEQEATPEAPHQIPVIVIQEEVNEEEPMAAAPAPEVAPQNQLALVPYQAAPAQATPHEATNPLDEFTDLTFPRFTHDDHYFVDDARANRVYEERYTAPTEADHATALYTLPENMRALALSLAASAGVTGTALARRNLTQGRQTFSRATRFLTRPPQRALPAPAQPRTVINEGAPYVEIMPRRQTEPLQLNPGARRRTIIDVVGRDVNTVLPQPQVALPRPATQPRALPAGQPNLLLNEGTLHPEMMVLPRRPLQLAPGARQRTILDLMARDVTPNGLGDINAQSPTRPGVFNRFDATPRQQPLLPAPRQPMALPEPTPQARPALVPLPIQAEGAPENILLREMHARNEQRAEQQAREHAEREAQAQRDAEQQRLEREARERLEQENQDRLARERAEQQAREQAEREAQAQRDAEQQRLERETRERLEQENQDRLARERTEQQAREQAQRETRERLEQETRDRAERERLEQENQDRLARERAEQEAREQAERELQAQRDAEIRAQELRNREAQERATRERAEQETREREAQAQRDREAQERLDRETRERLERENRARQEAEAQALRDRETQQRLEREAQARAEEQTPRAPRIPRTARRGNFTNTNRPGFAPRMPVTQRPIIHTASAFPHPAQTPPTQTAANPLEEFLPTMVRNNNNNPVPDLPTVDQGQAHDVQENQSTETQTDNTPKEEKPVKDRPVIEEEDDDDDDEVSPATQKTKKKKKLPQAMPADLDTPEEAQAPSRARSAKPKQAQPQYDVDRLGRNTGDGVTILEDNHPANRILATPQEKTPPVAIISTVAGTEHGSTGQGQETHLFIPKPCPDDKIYKKDKRPGMLQYGKSDVQECYKLQEADVTATYSDTFKEIFGRLKNLASSLFEALVGPTRP